MEPYVFEERKSRGKKLPSDYLMFNMDPSKPNVGCKPRVEETVEATRKKIHLINVKMARLAKDLRASEGIDFKKIDEFQGLNKQLYGLRIYEAQMVYLKNLL